MRASAALPSGLRSHRSAASASGSRGRKVTPSHLPCGGTVILWMRPLFSIRSRGLEAGYIVGGGQQRLALGALGLPYPNSGGCVAFHLVTSRYRHISR
jgi:hypothetical protein